MSLSVEPNFTVPPLGLPLELCLDFHLKANPDYPAFIYPNLDAEHKQACTYAEFVPAVHRAGRVLSERVSMTPNGSPQLVIGVIAQTDSLTYLTILSGLMRAGIIPFPISYRFSSNMIAHLLEKSHPAAIIVDPTTESLAVEAINTYTKDIPSQDRPVLLALPTLATLYPGHNEYIPLPTNHRRPEDPAIMVHSSSSSSGFPNIIPWSSLAVSHHGEIEETPSQYLCGKILRGCSLEFFHSMALSLFFMVVKRGLIMSFPNPCKPMANEVDDDVFSSFDLIKPDIIVTHVPKVESWAECPQKISALQRCGARVFYGGRFLSRTVANKLVAGGVKVCTAYGSTETGPISFVPQFGGDDWEYFLVKPRPGVVFVPREDGLLELVVSPMNGDNNYLTAVNTTWEGRPAYNPGDLFIAHANKPHTYKMFGRMSDQILLASGVTINPVELETELISTPNIASAVMFGHRRSTVGVIIEPVRGVSQSKDIESMKSDFIDEIWPTIVQANLKVPSDSRIARNMIIVAHEAKSISDSLSLKGLPRRALVWQQYQDEIDILYRAHA